MPPKKKKSGNVSLLEIHGENVIGSINSGGTAHVTVAQNVSNNKDISPRMAGDISTDAPPPDVNKKKKRKGK